MKLSKKEMDACRWSKDTQGVYKQYNPMKSRWEVRVLGRQMSTKKWANWTRLLRCCEDNAVVESVLREMRKAGATIWDLDSHGTLIVREDQ